MPQSRNIHFKVAVPWNLTHYIPLNGFHPLYRALFESTPQDITFSIWDNVALSNYLRKNLSCRKSLLKMCKEDQARISLKRNSSEIHAKHFESLYFPNHTLTKLLDGNIEFHHTAPYPSMTRPFVFHCESFAPIFYPFAHQGTGNFLSYPGLKEYYQEIFEHEFCLGVFSHLQETLDSISLFFQSEEIDKKLFLSRVGLSDTITPAPIDHFDDSEELKFFFMNSAHQNPKNFFNRGGHIVLRFFEQLYAQKIPFQAYMRCSKPSDELLQEYDIDVMSIHAMMNTHIIWIETYLTDNEMNSLIKNTHFTLLPSHSLHSVSIMHAMRSGSIPIVTDTIGTSLYVKDGINGVVLKGMYESCWKKDTNSGIMFDTYRQDKILDDSLVNQLLCRVMDLWSNPNEYNKMRNHAIETSKVQFSAQAFAISFWEHVRELKNSVSGKEENSETLLRVKLFPSYLPSNRNIDLFKSSSFPMTQIFTGDGYIVELASVYIYTKKNQRKRIHDWSILWEYVEHTPTMIYARSMKELTSYLMVNPNPSILHKKQMIIKKISNQLDSFPQLKKPIKKFYKLFFKSTIIRENNLREENELVKSPKIFKGLYDYFKKSYIEYKKKKLNNGTINK